MIRDPYIGMPIIVGGLPGVCPDEDGGNMPDCPQPQPPMPPRPPQADDTIPPCSQPDDHWPPAGDGFDARLLGSLPLAMSYVPMQQWKTTYSPSVALMTGTVFPELDLPFAGRRIG